MWQILRRVGFAGTDASQVRLRLTCDANPAEDIEFPGDCLVTMASACVRNGRFTTSVGAVGMLSVASEVVAPALQTGTTASAVSGAQKGFTSTWKLCLRWYPSMRRRLLLLPEAARQNEAIATLAKDDSDMLFIILRHVQAMRSVIKKVSYPHSSCARAGLFHDRIPAGLTTTVHGRT